MRITPALACLTLALAMALPAAAQDFEFPARKPGQWSIDIDTGTGQTIAMQVCLDEATDKQLMSAGLSMSDDMCSDVSMQNQGSDIVIDATCTMGTMKTSSHSVLSGDFQSAYTVTVNSTIEGAPAGMPAESTITQKATWLGECTDGMAPGDMLMPGGMKMNVHEMMQTMGGGG